MSKSKMSFKFKMIMIILILFFFIASFLVINVVDFASGNKKQTESVSTLNKGNKKKATQKEKLELTQDVVDLEIGAVFDFTQYIKTAEDKYGYSIKNKLKVKGKIPTDKEGQYQVEYILNLDDGKKINKILKVNIKSFD